VSEGEGSPGWLGALPDGLSPGDACEDEGEDDGEGLPAGEGDGDTPQAASSTARARANRVIFLIRRTTFTVIFRDDR
jgi:hypothetical protein